MCVGIAVDAPPPPRTTFNILQMNGPQSPFHPDNPAWRAANSAAAAKAAAAAEAKAVAEAKEGAVIDLPALSPA